MYKSLDLMVIVKLKPSHIYKYEVVYKMQKQQRFR